MIFLRATAFSQGQTWDDLFRERLRADTYCGMIGITIIQFTNTTALIYNDICFCFSLERFPSIVV